MCEKKHYSEISPTSCYKLCIFTINTFSIPPAMLKISKKRARNTPHHSFEGMHRFRNALKQ
ncbi:hypothetical protein BFV93_3825 [Alteromonas macleodii]|nr:hypothetical protein BFV93_3825 [Alteromonas macleodii]